MTALRLKVQRWFELAHREEHVHPTLALHLKDAALACEHLLDERDDALAVLKAAVDEAEHRLKGAKLLELDLRRELAVLAAGCPSCGVRDPLECTCTQEERFRAAQANGEINPWG